MKRSVMLSFLSLRLRISDNVCDKEKDLMGRFLSCTCKDSVGEIRSSNPIRSGGKGNGVVM